MLSLLSWNLVLSFKKSETRCLNICQINPNDINLLQFVVCRNSQAEFSNGTFLFEDCIADTGGAVSVSRRRE